VLRVLRIPQLGDVLCNLDELVSAFLEHCANVRGLSANTVCAYENDLRQFCSALTAFRSDEPLCPTAIRETLMRIVRDPNLAPTTIRRRLAAIRTFLRATDPKLARDTFDSWQVHLQMPRRLPRALSNTDFRALFGSLGPLERDSLASTTRLCLWMLVSTELRVSELCSLTLAQIRLETGEILVRGKGARERIVIIANKVVRVSIAKHIQTLPHPHVPNARLFINRRGAPMTPQCLRLRVHALAREAGLSRAVTPHMFRHYTHVTDAELRNALAKADVISKFL
jgi:site-specific recombinase XerD